ncbi:MAG: ABC transporter permease [Chloroflexota bacterium]
MSAIATATRATPSLSPTLAFLRLELRRVIRNRRYLVMTVVLPVTLYVLYTSVLRDTSGGGLLDGLTWPAYFLVSMAVYGSIGAAMSQTVPIATERRTGWVRQLRVTPLPAGAYVVGKVAAALLATIPALALMAAVGIAVNHVGLGASGIVTLVVTLAIGSLPFATLGALLGYLLDVESAQGGMVLTFFALAVLGGLFVPLDAFPDALAAVGRVLPSGHLAAVGRATLAGRMPDVGDVAVLVAWTLVLGALAAWRYRTDARSRG